MKTLSFWVSPRVSDDKELDGVNLAHERIQVLGHLRLGFENGQKGHQWVEMSSNQWLRAVVTGGLLHLSNVF